MAEVVVKPGNPPAFRTIPTTPLGKPSKLKSGRYAVLIEAVVRGLEVAGRNGIKTPGWIADLLDLALNGGSRRLSRRFRLRSCECCAVIARRVGTYMGPGSQRLEYWMDRHALPGRDDVPRFRGNRKSRAN